MFRDMRLATFLQKVKHLNEQALPASRTLQMATLEGAKAINWDKEIGSIEKGKKADIVMVDVDKANALPLYEPISHLIYAASGTDVSMTMIDGKIVYQDGKFLTLDFERVKNVARKYQDK